MSFDEIRLELKKGKQAKRQDWGGSIKYAPDPRGTQTFVYLMTGSDGLKSFHDLTDEDRKATDWSVVL